MFVIKTNYGAFVNRSSLDSRELNFTFTDIERAEKYSEGDIKVMRERFKGSWRDFGFEVYKVIMTLEKAKV